MSLVQIWGLVSRLADGDPEEIIELVGFHLVVDVYRGLITIRSSITDPIFCLGCSHSRRAEHGDSAELQEES